MRTIIKANYKLRLPQRYKEVRYYDSITPITDNLLKPIVNISVNRQFNKSENVAYWYKNKGQNDTKLSGCITGLKRTNDKNIFYGDIPTKINGRFRPQHLIIFRFSEDLTALQIEIYKDYYPYDIEEILRLI